MTAAQKLPVEGSVVVVANAYLPRVRDAALDFARNGWFVILTGRSEAALLELKKYIEISGGIAHVVRADPGTRQGRLRIVHEAQAWFGRIDRWIGDDARLDTQFNGDRAPTWRKWKLLLIAASTAASVGFMASRMRRLTR